MWLMLFHKRLEDRNKRGERAVYDFNKIKLVIWDLDDSFWTGTLSEGEISTPLQNIKLVNRLTDIGIVNSICSKNDLEPVQKKLKELGVLDQFVFMSVNWEPKGGRIKQMISDMQLRPVNVLFIDDNPSNLEEARFFCPELMTMSPENLPELFQEALGCNKEDLSHKRLIQYRILEEKQNQKKQFVSNEEFLYSSNIQVSFGQDCSANLERIHDLVWRSNQLNFTKVRSTKEELRELFADKSVNCGYVRVSDRFGDYGITGFYALKDKKLIHFCFSCRTLGMGIEQYVYGKLGRPELQIVGEVVSDLSREEIPGWINQNSHSLEEKFIKVKNRTAHSVLIKGPCDLFQILPYIANKSIIDTEFTYVNKKGVTIESTGHTTHIVEAMRLSDIQKQQVLSEVPFADEGIYSKQIYDSRYKIVIISILQDANLGVYRRKGTGERIAFLEGYHPITDSQNWDSYITEKYNCSGFKFTEENFRCFSEQYEFVGINTPDQIVENLRYIRKHLSNDCMMVVMLGGELYYEKNTFPAYENRHLVHKEINDAIRAVADDLNIRLIDVNRYLVDQSSFYDHFNHYIKPVYYQLAGEIVALINEQTGAQLKETSKLKMIQVHMKEVLAPIYYKIRKVQDK